MRTGVGAAAGRAYGKEEEQAGQQLRQGARDSATAQEQKEWGQKEQKRREQVRMMGLWRMREQRA